MSSHPSITKILKETRIPSSQRGFQCDSSWQAFQPDSSYPARPTRAETIWTRDKRRKRGSAIEERIYHEILMGKKEKICSESVEEYFNSLEKVRLFPRMNLPGHIEPTIVCENNGMPYLCRLDWLGSVDGKSTVVEFTATERLVVTLEDIDKDKPLQLAAQVRACRYRYSEKRRILSSPVEQGMIVVAQPFGKAEIFTFTLPQLKELWKECDQRIKQFYAS